jgi:oxygen-independent coproporphyrinogen-3 oxidase
VSIYFGGGTPSLWEPACIAAAIAAVRERFAATGALEITLEANPTDCTTDRLDAWRAAGVTRLSIGVQSLAADELVVLGRDHRFGDGPAAVARAVAHGGFAVSADFILGTPPRGAHAWPEIVALGAAHLSVYELTIEERTAFGARARAGTLVPLPDDQLAELYTRAHDALTAAGYEHYEISSYARPGARAVHNSLYWSGAPFLGLGVGAASLQLDRASGAGERATNPRRAADYLAGAPPEVTQIPPAEMAADRAWLAMRTRDGVAESDLAHAPGAADEWLAAGLVTRAGGRICPTLRGFLFADRIAARIVQSWR